jgi:hypothetical protein
VLCGRLVTAKAERHKTLTGLTNTEPVVGAQLPRAQRLQWFLWESDWQERLVTNLPAPSQRAGSEPLLPAADLPEVMRLYGLRMWVEQSSKHHELPRILRTGVRSLMRSRRGSNTCGKSKDREYLLPETT